MYCQPAHFQCRARARRRGNEDVHAERDTATGSGRAQALLRSVLGSHVVDFSFFSPNRETGPSRLKSTIRAVARQRGVLVQSSHAGDLAMGLGRRPRPLGMHMVQP